MLELLCGQTPPCLDHELACKVWDTWAAWARASRVWAAACCAWACARAARSSLCSRRAVVASSSYSRCTCWVDR